MMRLLFLCLLLVPTINAVSEENEGSAVGDQDDEDLTAEETDLLGKMASDTLPETAEEETADQVTLIVIIVAVTALTLSVAAIVTIMFVKRQKHKRQQGIYSVPTEQDHKGV